MKSYQTYRLTSLSILTAFFLMLPKASAIHREGRNVSRNESVFRTTSPTILDLGGGIIVSDGASLPGMDLQIAARLNTETRFFAGGELGLFFYSGTGSSAAVIPILGTVYTEFDASHRVHPMLGISVGPTFSTGGGYSTARFTFLINPGVRFDLGSAVDLNTQVRFGAIGASFVVLPQVGLSFAI